jgi:hypothetical protein
MTRIAVVGADDALVKSALGELRAAGTLPVLVPRMSEAEGFEVTVIFADGLPTDLEWLEGWRSTGSTVVVVADEAPLLSKPTTDRSMTVIARSVWTARGVDVVKACRVPAVEGFHSAPELPFTD